MLTYNYSLGFNSDISWLSSVSDSTGTLESYDYLGQDTVVKRGHSQPGVDLTYIAASGTGDAGDQYTGLDRFGRVVDQQWVECGTPLDRFQYGYDRDSNRLYRDNAVNSAFGELYSYDGFNQIATFDRGTLNGGKTAITGTVARSQGFDFDALGNFDGVTTNGTTQSRTANAQNEITSIGGATTPTYDANGNMTGDETGRQFVYDAWNRLVTVKNSSGTTLEAFSYDGTNKRITVTASGTTTDLFYSAGWQVLEEKVGSATTTRYVWSPVYVDAMILRDRDTNADGTLDERLWVTQDANWNVTALVDGSGAVVERFAYDAFGAQTVYDASYTVRGGGSSYGWVYGFQGGRYDAVSGLSYFRNRDYSATLGRWTSVDPIRFAGGDVNMYGFVGSNPLNATDPIGLYNPTKVFPLLSSEAQAAWYLLEHNGKQGEANRQKTGGLQGFWLKYDEDKPAQSADASTDENIKVSVTDKDMIARLLRGDDVEWVADKWAVDYSHRRIWIDRSLSDKDAVAILNIILPALASAGKPDKWDNKSMDVSLGIRDGNLGAKTTVEAMKDWQILKQIVEVDKGTNANRRTVMMIWALKQRAAVKAIGDLINYVPLPGGGLPKPSIKLVTDALKLYGDADSADQLELKLKEK